MLNTYHIPARSLQKSYKSIIESVKAKKRPAILTTNKKPQAAIISMDDLEKLQQTKATQVALEMLNLATEAREDFKKLPADLRQQADKILYTK